jgi:hypothetical protein
LVERTSRWSRWLRVAAKRVGVILLIVAAATGGGAVLLYIVSHIPTPPPPAAVSDAVRTGEERIREIPGVNTVTIHTNADLKDGGPLDQPEAWLARIVVSLEPRLTDAPAVTQHVVAAAEEIGLTVATSGTLQIPPDTSGAEVSITFTGSNVPTAESESVLDLAMKLRQMSLAISVSVDAGSAMSIVTIASPAGLPEAVTATAALTQEDPERAGIVEISASGRENQNYASIWVGPDTAPPTVELLDAVARFSDDPTVSWVEFDAARDPSGAERTEPWRPHLRIKANSPDDLSAITASLTSIEVDFTGAGAPRPSFSAFALSDTDPHSVEVEGYLGLPVGSSEPDDALPGVDIVDPVQEEAAVQKGLALVNSVLQEAASTTRTGDTGNTIIVECDADAGRQVTGRVLLPVTDQIRSQEQTFAVIVESWEARGFVRSDRALGTDLFSGDGLQLSIRGTSEGISISATSTCSGRP